MSSPSFGEATTTPPPIELDTPARVVANSAWLLLAQGVATLVGGGISIYAVRHFTTGTWGHYSTALALVAVFTIFSGPGLAPLALRELIASPERQDEILGMTFQALAGTACLAAFALFAATFALGYPHQVVVLVLLLAAMLVLDPLLANLASAFNARSRLVYVASFQLAQSLVYGTLAVLVIATSRSVTGLAFATLVAALCAASLGLVVLRVKFRSRPRLHQPRRRSWLFLRAAIPIAGVSLVGVVYDRVDILMLSVLSNASSVAHYTVPYGFVRLSWILPSVVSAAFFPLLSRKIDAGSSDAEYLFFLVVRVFLFCSLPISLMLALSSPTLLPFVFGHPYTQSIPVLQIMAWTSVFGFQNYILWYGVLASHQERALLGIQLGGLVVNVCVNAFAIPLYGPSGAAAALVASDLIVVVGQVVLIHRNLFRVPLVDLLLKPVGAAVVVVPVAVLVARWSAVGGALTGAAAYVAILLVLRYVTVEEWRPLTAFILTPIGLMRRTQ